MNKLDAFAREIEYIKTPRYQQNLKSLIELLPDYFFEVEASSTGKYHPSYAQGEGGLLRHTKAAVRIGQELLQNQMIGGKYGQEEKDMMLIAIILHDGLKHGLVKNQYTQVDHPKLMADYIKEHKSKLTFTGNEIAALTAMIATHMGEFNKDYKGNVVLDVPENKYQKFVHLCDYLASRKFLEVPFDGNEVKY